VDYREAGTGFCPDRKEVRKNLDAQSGLFAGLNPSGLAPKMDYEN
jgi:hypothetical protein